MPRLSTIRYLRTHVVLKQIWFNGQDAYSLLLPNSKTLSAKELLAHRKAITARRPSLPQQAGRALSKLKARVAGRVPQRQPVVAGAGGRAKGPKRIDVYSVVNPEIDVDKVVQALLILSRQMVMKDRPTTDPWLDSEGLRKQEDQDA